MTLIDSRNSKQTGYRKEKCHACGSWNDIGQQTITVNSMKQIYEGCLSLMQYVAGTCGALLEAADIDFKGLKDALDMSKTELLSVSVQTELIVRTLFLSQGSCGGTSVGNLKHLLDLKEERVSFLLEEYNECDIEL